MEATVVSRRVVFPHVRLMYITSIILLGFVSIGVPFAFLPQYVTDHLGFGNLSIGLLIGTQSIVTLLTRHVAGTQADLKGAKSTVIIGLSLTAIAGLVSLAALSMQDYFAMTTLFMSRAILGFGESFLITGALSWGIGLLGPANSGRIMSWSGIAMYSSIALSASLSSWLATLAGPSGVLGLTIAAPLAALVIAIYTPGVTAVGKERIPFYTVIGKVWRAGVALSLSAIGFAAIASFAGLYFDNKGWEHAPAMMALFGIFFVAARVFFGHMPDKYGGRRVGGLSALIEAVGLLLIWIAPHPLIAILGAAFTGFGYSLVFPSFGVEAVRKIDAQFRGAGIGAYVAFFDLALGATGPLAGVIAAGIGLSAVFVLGSMTSVIAALIARKL